MLYLLFVVCTLGASAVKIKVEEPENIQLGETGRFINIDDLKALYGVKLGLKEDNSNKRYYSQKYNEDPQINYKYNSNDDDNRHGYHNHGSNDAKQDKVVADFFRPVYDQPTWVFDYRNMKTGGRHNAHNPTSQILTLPNDIHTEKHTEFNDYGSTLEDLGLKNIAKNVPFQQPAYMYDRKEVMNSYY